MSHPIILCYCISSRSHIRFRYSGTADSSRVGYVKGFMEVPAPYFMPYTNGKGWDEEGMVFAHLFVTVCVHIVVFVDVCVDRKSYCNIK